MAVRLDESRGAILEDDARAGRDDPGAERPVDALDERDRGAVAVDGAQVGRPPTRKHRRARLERASGVDEPASFGEVRRVEQLVGQRPVRDVGVDVGEGELHRLDLRVEPRLEPVVERESEERRGSLPVRRELADLDPAVVVAERVDPLGAVRGEVVLLEPARCGDRLGDAAAVEGVRAVGGEESERRGEVGDREPLPQRGRGERDTFRARPLVRDAGGAGDAA